MAKQRQILTREDVEFEVRFAIGRVPNSIWVRVRGKDRIKSQDAIERVVQLIADRFDKLEVIREFDPQRAELLNILGPPRHTV